MHEDGDHHAALDVLDRLSGSYRWTSAGKQAWDLAGDIHDDLHEQKLAGLEKRRMDRYLDQQRRDEHPAETCRGATLEGPLGRHREAAHPTGEGMEPAA